MVETNKKFNDDGLISRTEIINYDELKLKTESNTRDLIIGCSTVIIVVLILVLTIVIGTIMGG